MDNKQATAPCGATTAVNNKHTLEVQLTDEQMEQCERDGMSWHELLHRHYRECEQCGSYVLKSDTDSTCDPTKKRAHAKYLRGKARVAAIRARMEQRECNFRRAQQQDELMIYRIERGR